jgi:hypothetical protein
VPFSIPMRTARIRGPATPTPILITGAAQMTGRGHAVRRSASPRSGHGHTATTYLRQERGNDGDGSAFVLARPRLLQRRVDRSKPGVELGAEPVHDGNDRERNAAAINPYLIAVAPASSAMNCLKLVVIDGHSVAFAPGTATGFSRAWRSAMLQSICVRAGSGNNLIVRLSDQTGTLPLAPQPRQPLINPNS